MRVGAEHAGEGIDGMADRRIRVQAPPPASEVLQPKSTTDAEIANRGVNLGLVGRLRSITADLFPQGVVFDLMQGLRVAADRILENFSVRNIHLADSVVDGRTADTGWVEQEHLGSALSGLLAGLEAEVGHLSIDEPDTSGVTFQQVLNAITARAVETITAGDGISANRVGSTVTIAATGQATAEGAPTALSISQGTPSLAADGTITRPVTVTLAREGLTDLAATVNLVDSVGGGGGVTLEQVAEAITTTVTRAYVEALGITGGTGLNQTQVDARVRTIVPAWARAANPPTIPSADIASAVAAYLTANPPGISTVAIASAVATYLTNNPIEGITEARARVIAGEEIVDEIAEWARAANPPATGVSEAEARTIAEGRINNLVERWARVGGVLNVPIAKIQGALNTWLTSATVTSRIQTVVDDSYIASWFRRKVMGS